jgi:hypothetical protein
LRGEGEGRREKGRRRVSLLSRTSFLSERAPAQLLEVIERRGEGKRGRGGEVLNLIDQNLLN